MVVPDIIELSVFRTPMGNPVFAAEVTLTVNSDSEIILGVVHKEDFTKLLFHINNSGSNSLDFQFYAAAKNDITSSNMPHDSPPDYDGTTAVWFALPNGSGTVTTLDSDGRVVTDNWVWVLITVKRTTTGLDTNGLLHARGE